MCHVQFSEGEAAQGQDSGPVEVERAWASNEVRAESRKRRGARVYARYSCICRARGEGSGLSTEEDDVSAATVRV
eukprot:6718445-Prymnesium_polylepis.1